MFRPVYFARAQIAGPSFYPPTLKVFMESEPKKKSYLLFVFLVILVISVFHRKSSTFVLHFDIHVWERVRTDVLHIEKGNSATTAGVAFKT